MLPRTDGRRWGRRTVAESEIPRQVQIEWMVTIDKGLGDWRRGGLAGLRLWLVRLRVGKSSDNVLPALRAPTPLSHGKRLLSETMQHNGSPLTTPARLAPPSRACATQNFRLQSTAPALSMYTQPCLLDHPPPHPCPSCAHHASAIRLHQGPSTTYPRFRSGARPAFDFDRYFARPTRGHPIRWLGRYPLSRIPAEKVFI